MGRVGMMLVFIWVRGAGYGFVNVVRMLLSNPRVQLAAGDHLAIRWASEKEHELVVNVLLEAYVQRGVKWRFCL